MRPKPKSKKAKAAEANRDPDDMPEEEIETQPHISVRCSPMRQALLLDLLTRRLTQMRNFELGIVFTLPADDTEERANEVACWRRPVLPYDDDDKPWVCAVPCILSCRSGLFNCVGFIDSVHKLRRLFLLLAVMLLRRRPSRMTFFLKTYSMLYTRMLPLLDIFRT